MWFEQTTTIWLKEKRSITMEMGSLAMSTSGWKDSAEAIDAYSCGNDTWCKDQRSCRCGKKFQSFLQAQFCIFSNAYFKWTSIWMKRHINCTYIVIRPTYKFVRFVGCAKWCNEARAGVEKEVGWMLLAAVISSMSKEELEEHEFNILALWTIHFGGIW